MHAPLLAAGDQLGEHDGQAPVARGVPDVVLARVVRGRVDDELLGLPVVGGGRAERLHVGAVAGLGHGEAAGQIERGDVAQVALVVAARAEVQHRAAEQAELDAALHEQRQIAHGEGLECGDALADRVLAPVLHGVSHGRIALRGQLAGPGQDPLAVLLHRQVVDGCVRGLRQPVADLGADVRVLAVQEAAQGLAGVHDRRFTRR